MSRKADLPKGTDKKKKNAENAKILRSYDKQLLDHVRKKHKKLTQK